MTATVPQLKWIQMAGAAVSVLCLVLFAYTGNIIAAAVPFALLFCFLLFVNWKTAYWLFLFFIPFSVDLTYLGLPVSTSLPDEPMMWLFVIMMFALLMNRSLTFPAWWLRHPLVLIMALQLFWLIIAVICSTDHLISLKFLLAKGWFMTAFAVLPIFIFKEKKDFILGFRLFLVSLTITILIVLYRHWKLNFGFLLINDATSYLYYNRVEYSTVISMFFALLCAAVPLTGNRPLQRWALIFLILLFLPAIYFTFARAAILAIVFMFVINFFIRRKLVQWVMPVFYSLIAAMVIYVARDNKYIDYRPTYDHTYTHKSLEDHLVATFRGEDMSSMERLYRWIAAIRMSKDHPWTGVGPNAFYDNYKPYAVSAFRTYVSRNPERSTTHNYFLFMLVEQGLPAMILYGILVMVFFIVAQKVYHRFKGRDKFYKQCTMGVAMMFAAGFINNFFSELLETHKVGALFYIGITLLIILDKKSRDLIAQ